MNTSVAPTADDFDTAVAHHQAGRFAEAEPLYRRVIAREPAHADALRLLGVLRFQCGDATEAERLVRQALVAAPGLAKAYDNLAYVLRGLGRDEEALPIMQRAVELAPDLDNLFLNLGSLLVALKRHPAAIAAFERGLAVNPRNANIHQMIGAERLLTGDARAALSHFDACVALGMNNAGIQSHRAIAFTELGDAAAVRALADINELVKPTTIGQAHGFPSLASFNAALAEHVARNVTLHEEKTTVHGLDTDELLEADEPCIVALKRFIYGQIEARLASLPGSTHPFTLTAPRKWGTDSWGVKMWRQGHQVTHIHHKAWLSGVYYVQLPEVVHEQQEGHEGWIEFGRGPVELYATAQPEVRLVRPVEGLLLTFPSYIWHRTIPFEGTRERISIAFDVIPVG
jgi:tetratricopeptide (TPR) repeat protein